MKWSPQEKHDWTLRRIDRMIHLMQNGQPVDNFDKLRLHPERLEARWKDRFTVRHISGNDHSIQDESYVGDDIAGYYHPSDENTGQLPTITIRDSGSKRRDFFTLLHEIGHHLQNTDPELASEIFNIDNEAEAKQLEEIACDRFAGRFLVPERILDESMQSSGADVTQICAIYRRTKASYEVIIRQLIAARMIDRRSVISIINVTDSNGTLGTANRFDAYGFRRRNETPSSMERRAIQLARHSHMNMRYITIKRTDIGIDPGTGIDTLSVIHTRYDNKPGAYIIMTRSCHGFEPVDPSQWWNTYSKQFCVQTIDTQPTDTSTKQ